MALGAYQAETTRGNVLNALAHPAVVNPVAAIGGAAQTARDLYGVRQYQADQAWGNALQQATDPSTGVVDYRRANALAAADPSAAMAMRAGLTDTSNLITAQQQQTIRHMSLIGSSALTLMNDPSDANLDKIQTTLLNAGYPQSVVNQEITTMRAMSPSDRQQYAYQHGVAAMDPNNAMGRTAGATSVEDVGNVRVPVTTTGASPYGPASSTVGSGGVTVGIGPVAGTDQFQWKTADGILHQGNRVQYNAAVGQPPPAGGQQVGGGSTFANPNAPAGTPPGRVNPPVALRNPAASGGNGDTGDGTAPASAPASAAPAPTPTSTPAGGRQMPVPLIPPAQAVSPPGQASGTPGFGSSAFGNSPTASPAPAPAPAPAQPAPASQRPLAPAPAPTASAAPAGPISGPAPGMPEKWDASSKMYTGAAADAANYQARTQPLMSAAAILRNNPDLTTGVGADAVNRAKSALMTMGSIFTPVDMQSIRQAKFDELGKYFQQVVNSNSFAAGSDARLASTISGSPNTHLSTLGNKDILTAMIGLERMKQMAFTDFQQSGQSPAQWSDFKSNWETTHDPRAFVLDMLGSGQRDKLFANLKTPAERTAFQNSLNLIRSNPNLMTQAPMTQ